MSLQSFIPYIPFLAVLYAVFAFVQTLRHKRQGTTAILLALLSIAAPVIAYLFATDEPLRASLLQYLAINEAIAFVVSLVILLIERRNTKRDHSRSYGMIGLGISLLLAVGTFALPLVATSASTTTTAVKNTAGTTNQSGLVLVSEQMPNEAANQMGSAAEATASVDATTPTEVATALTAQTGLSADDVLAKVQAGSTIADLVKSNNGKLDPVVSAIVKALDTLVTAGGREAQMISSMGSDTTQMATQLVEGTLGQAQQFLLPQLITGKAPTPPNGQAGGMNGVPPDGSAGAANGQPVASESTETVSANSAGSAQILVTNTPQPTATESVVRPTQIVFPTITQTPAVTTAPEATGTGTASTVSSSAAATCNLVIDYNLNLRDKPTTEGSKVYLSIPFGSTITAEGHTTDGWYKVTYNGQTGWVNDAYVTAAAACSSLLTVSGS